MLRKFFLDHPRSVGESYTGHGIHAFSFGARMVVGGLACFVHGLIPALCVKTGSSTVRSLYTEMQPRADMSADPGASDAAASPQFLPEYEI